jgi:aspartate aminotransferase
MLLTKFMSTLIFLNCSIGSIPGMFDKTITVNGVAKAFAMTGYRIGCIYNCIAKACTKYKSVTSGANSPAQRATITAVDADPSVLKHMVDAFTRRDLVVGIIERDSYKKRSRRCICVP